MESKNQIKLEHHPNALDDTRACFEILEKFEELYPEESVPQQYFYRGAEIADAEAIQLKEGTARMFSFLAKLEVLPGNTGIMAPSMKKRAS